MTIAIIGSGRIGSGLARRWRQAGHDIVFAARQPSDAALQALCAELGARAATVPEAVRAATVAVLAMPYGALDEVIGAADWDGRLVIDATNAVQRGPDGTELKHAPGSSASEELARRLPRARVFKSFNAQGAENLADPMYDGVRASNFFCGDDADGRVVMRQLVEDAGFDPVDAGPLRHARLLEPLMLLWMAVAGTSGSREVAFRLLRRS